MAVVRRRYYIWLIKAYLRRWSRTVLLSLLLGSLFFFGVLLFFSFYIRPILEKKVEKVGLWGIYTPSSLPHELAEQVSYGLTTITEDGSIQPRASAKWEVLDDGRTYRFYLRRNQIFHNGGELKSENLPIDFKEVVRKNTDSYVVEYSLKKAYSPFLAAVSRPLLLKGGVGLGEYEISNVETNAGFLKSVSLQHAYDKRQKKIYFIYPTEQALLTAFMLGEVDVIKGLHNIPSDFADFSKWSRVKVDKKVDYTSLVAIFYNVRDENLSNLKFRQALNYALPAVFDEGVRSDSPIPPLSKYYNKAPNAGIYDIEIAKTLLEDSSTNVKKLEFEIASNSELSDVAKTISSSWKKIGVKAKIKEVDGLPDDFQIFIHSFRIPADPDQYTLWHSDQINNITGYKNDRIDKLLEDGRVISNEAERIEIYSNFQKYLMNDTPASFLYFPYEYIITRK